MKTQNVMRFKNILLVLLVLMVSMGLVITYMAQSQAYTIPPIPNVSGPITGPGPIYPGLSETLTTGTAPEDFGYITQEYFVSGTANEQPYAIRILVRRPELIQKFSGIVVSECMHSNGTSVTLGPMRVSVMVRGHIHVEMAAQVGNVNTLNSFNPDRYGTLTVPNGQTSEIIAQVGTLIKSNPVGGPLAPLFARKLILQGTSQSSNVLRSYQNLHFLYRMPDASAIFDGYFATSTLGPAPMMVVDVPTVQMPTQTEVRSAALSYGEIPYRRPDSDALENPFRIYEVAGMPHANTRDRASYVPNPCDLPISDFPWGAMAAMGLNHLVDWIDSGTIPPHAPYIETDGNNLKLDSFGNVLGGVRNTYVDFPVAQYGVPNANGFTCSIAGYRLILPKETLDSLYKNRGQYISVVNQRLNELIRKGWFLKEYADIVRSDSQEVSKTLIKPQK